MSNNDEEIKQLMEDCLPKKKSPTVIKYVSEIERFERRKLEARRIARELHYDEDIIDKIKEAKTTGDIDRALREGRHRITEFSFMEEIKKKKKKGS